MKKIKISLILLFTIFLFLGYLYADTPTIDSKYNNFKDSITGMEFIFVKGGCFKMGDAFGDGDPDEKPEHEVCIDDFYMGETEITQKQWKEIMGNNPSYVKGWDDCPVENVSWYDAQEYIRRINQKTGKKYRLPTEAEWEYAASSGGKKEKWAGTNNESEIKDYAWYWDNSEFRTHQVKKKRPNGLGLYDMSGNVWEWCLDLYKEKYYGERRKKNPKGPSKGIYRVLRGGSWLDNPWGARTIVRNWYEPDGLNNVIGFRLAHSAK